MSVIKMIVGLSNPLEKYRYTRHNMGAWYMELLVKNSNLYLIDNKKFLGFTSSIIINEQLIRLFLPNIFMNINGIAIYKIASFYGINLNEILIVHDDLDLNPGIVKLKYSYGHSGHNGLRNVINNFGKKNNFYRLRIGIGRPQEKKTISSFVLSKPTHNERVLIKQSLESAIQKTFLLIRS